MSEALVVTPPTFRFKPAGTKEPTIFLAGSIEMGAAEDWQAHAIAELRRYYSIIYNPRRPDWNSDWTQEIGNPHFNVQVTWELTMIEQADVVLFYFDPNTKSPVTMMELGMCAASKPEKTFVCCPPGFWRKGNIDIMAERYGLRAYDHLGRMLMDLRQHAYFAAR